MPKIDDAALSWANGFIHGMEYMAGAILDRVDGGQDAAGAILSGQLAGLLFIEGLVMSTQDRVEVVGLFRQQQGGLSYGQKAASD